MPYTALPEKKQPAVNFFKFALTTKSNPGPYATCWLPTSLKQTQLNSVSSTVQYILKQCLWGDPVKVLVGTEEEKTLAQREVEGTRSEVCHSCCWPAQPPTGQQGFSSSLNHGNCVQEGTESQINTCYLRTHWLRPSHHLLLGWVEGQFVTPVCKQSHGLLS